MSNVSNASPDSSTAVMRPHAGSAIMTAAESYSTVFAVLLETIQNAMDANAINVWIDIDWKKRRIDVFDDGDGVTREKFYEALQSVGHTIKDGQINVYGEFGRGLVAPLGKCKYFTFTSNGLSWKFDTKVIRESADDISIPETEVPIVFSRSKQKNHPHSKDPNWRTRVTMFDIVRDKATSRFDPGKLLDSASTIFRTKMLENNVVLHLTIQYENDSQYTMSKQAEPYSGIKLEVFERELILDKRARFLLFLALNDQGKYRGKISIGTIANPFRMPFEVFMKSVDVRELLDEEIVEALMSGVFEGDLLSNALVLNPDRVGFEINDGLTEFCIAIEEWYRVVGHAHYQEINNREDSERFERNASKALDALSKLFDRPGMDALAELVQSFPANLIGIGGREVSDDDTDDEVNVSGKPKSPKTGPSKTGSRKKGSGKSGEKRTTKSKVVDPAGKERATVKTQEFGLSLGETQNLPGPWQLDVGRGILWINTRHALYLQCADQRNADLCIRRYQQHVAIQALSLHCSPLDSQHHAAAALDIVLSAFVQLMTQ